MGKTFEPTAVSRWFKTVRYVKNIINQEPILLWKSSLQDKLNQQVAWSELFILVKPLIVTREFWLAINPKCQILIYLNSRKSWLNYNRLLRIILIAVIMWIKYVTVIPPYLIQSTSRRTGHQTSDETVVVTRKITHSKAFHQSKPVSRNQIKSSPPAQ